jgi:hypothetical protein
MDDANAVRCTHHVVSPILKPPSKQASKFVQLKASHITAPTPSGRRPLPSSKQAPSLCSHSQRHELHLAIYLLPIPLFQASISSSIAPPASSTTAYTHKETRTSPKAYTRSTQTRQKWQTQQPQPQRCHLTIFAPVRCRSGVLLLPQ